MWVTVLEIKTENTEICINLFYSSSNKSLHVNTKNLLLLKNRFFQKTQKRYYFVFLQSPFFI